MATKTKKADRPLKRPERKFGPFHNGLGLAIWLNEVQTERGPRFFRSLTLSPRRYRDSVTGEWKDAQSYRPVDIPTLVLSLEAAQRFMASTPLPGQAVDGDELQDMHVDEYGEIVDGQPQPT